MQKLLVLASLTLFALPLTVMLPAPGWNYDGKHVHLPPVDRKHPFTLAAPFILNAQISLPFGSTSSGGFPASPVTGMQLWVSADCVILTGSTCSSPANNTQFTSGGQTTWADRSANNAAMTWGFGGFNGCFFRTNKVNSLPAVEFPQNCGFNLGGAIDVASTTTTWTEFAVFQNKSTSYKGDFTGGTATSGSPNSFKYWTGSTKEQGADKDCTAQIGTGTAAEDTSWHVISIQYTIGSNASMTLDGATDTTIGFSSQSIPGTSVAVGASRCNAVYQEFLNAFLAEFIVYSSATTALPAGDITSNLNYLRHKYGQI